MNIFGICPIPLTKSNLVVIFSTCCLCFVQVITGSTQNKDKAITVKHGSVTLLHEMYIDNIPSCALDPMPVMLLKPSHLHSVPCCP